MAEVSFAFFLLFLLPIGLLAVLFFLVRPRPVKIPIKNRHVFITGGSSGIGLALAHRAAAEGARVSILARSPDKLEEARNAIRHRGGGVLSGRAGLIGGYAGEIRDPVIRSAEEAASADVVAAVPEFGAANGNSPVNLHRFLHGSLHACSRASCTYRKFAFQKGKLVSPHVPTWLSLRFVSFLRR